MNCLFERQLRINFLYRLGTSFPNNQHGVYRLLIIVVIYLIYLHVHISSLNYIFWCNSKSNTHYWHAAFIIHRFLMRPEPLYFPNFRFLSSSFSVHVIFHLAFFFLFIFKTVRISFAFLDEIVDLVIKI